MENQSNQQSKKKFHTQHYGAHSNFRGGLSDYNDGGHNSHYGGNDDKYSSESEANEDFDGTEAAGNDLEVDEEDYGKSHSGL
jgi:hypothetical protein